MRSLLSWLLPFLVSGGMAFGALIGMSLFGNVATQEGAAGDTAGAAGALMILICIVSGFTMALLAVIIAKFFRHGTFDRFALRLGISILGGVLIGSSGPSDKEFMIVLTWLLLISFPIICAWPWPLQHSPTPNKEEVHK